MCFLYLQEWPVQCRPKNITLQCVTLLQVLLKWSSHYWSIIYDLLSGTLVLGKQLPLDLESRTPESLLVEAQMNLANAALYKHDTNKALRLYSQVKTPQAAWNQSQVHVCIIVIHV